MKVGIKEVDIQKIRTIKQKIDEELDRLLDLAEELEFNDYELEERVFYKIQRAYRELSELYEDLDIIEERYKRSS